MKYLNYQQHILQYGEYYICHARPGQGTTPGFRKSSPKPIYHRSTVKACWPATLYLHRPRASPRIVLMEALSLTLKFPIRHYNLTIATCVEVHVDFNFCGCSSAATRGFLRPFCSLHWAVGRRPWSRVKNGCTSFVLGLRCDRLAGRRHIIFCFTPVVIALVGASNIGWGNLLCQAEPMFVTLHSRSLYYMACHYV